MNARRSIPLPILGVLVSAPALAQLQTAFVPCAADVAIYSESASAANGAGENLFVGANSAGDRRRSLVRFDLAAVIPAGSIVVAASMTVNVNQGNAGFEPLEARRVLADWIEGPSNPAGSEGQGSAASGTDVTWMWRNFAAGSAWTTPGGDFAPASGFAGLLAESSATSFSANAVGLADLQSMLDQPAQDFGWALLGNEGAPSTAKRLDSRSSANTAVRPSLLVVFFGPGAQPSPFCSANANSSGAPASIGSTGSTSVAANDLVLTVSSAPANTMGLFFFGTSAGAQTPFGNGFRCAVGPYRRLGIQAVGLAGTAARALDLTAFPGTLLSPGSIAAFQFWFRDTAAGGAGFNTSPGLLAGFFP